eukprot:2664487-Amphidinium_carterae.1
MGGNLTVLTKSSGSGHRPIAVGETLRRLVCKVATQVAMEEVKSHLAPLQVGVGVSGACEGVIHAVRQWFHRNRDCPDKVIVTLDIANVFNTMDRSAFASVVRHLIPGCAPWVDLAYLSHSKLKLQNQLLLSARGIQQ